MNEIDWAELAEHDPELFEALIRLKALPPERRQWAYKTALRIANAAYRWQEGVATEDDVALLDYWSLKVNGKPWEEAIAERKGEV